MYTYSCHFYWSVAIAGAPALAVICINKSSFCKGKGSAVVYWTVAVTLTILSKKPAVPKSANVMFVILLLAVDVKCAAVKPYLTPLTICEWI